jgi:hypothetical protein
MDPSFLGRGSTGQPWAGRGGKAASCSSLGDNRFLGCTALVAGAVGPEWTAVVAGAVYPAL